MKNIEKNVWKERINYEITEGYYVGTSVNCPFVIQAKSLDELKAKTRSLMGSYINDLQRTLDSNLFEYVEQNAR